jgi:hypothetical protein
VPADEVEILDELDGLDADAVKQRDRIAWPDVKKAVITQHTFAQIFTMHSMLVILPNPLIIVFNALRWLSMKSKLRSFLAICSASRCALSFTMSLCSTKLKIVMELISKFTESRPVLWTLQLRRDNAKFFQMWYKDLWVMRGLSLLAISDGISAKTVDKILTAWMVQMDIGIARMFFMACV